MTQEKGSGEKPVAKPSCSACSFGVPDIDYGVGLGIECINPWGQDGWQYAREHGLPYCPGFRERQSNYSSG